MAGIWDWSPTASSNTTCDSIGTATGMNPANVDNVLRSIMALVRSSFASALQNFLGGTAPLPISNGGTAATDAATALANLGGLSSAYQRLPIIGKTVAFSPVDSEAGSAYYWTGGAAALTLNPQSTTAITAGSVFVIRNAGGSLTVTRGSGVTLNVNGSTSSADAVLAVGGRCTLIYWGGDTWTVDGINLT